MLLQIINNLDRYIKEKGANEELIPIILVSYLLYSFLYCNHLLKSSMEIWDEKMQSECALSFQRDEVIKFMSLPNQQKLMEECVNIILNAGVEHEEVRINKTLIHIIVHGVMGQCV